MLITLQRRFFTNRSTLGELYFDDVFECMTLEDPVRPPGVKIPGDTAIPYGEFKVVMTWSPKFYTMLPELLAIPNYSKVRLHWGNGPRDTEGCILTGRTWESEAYIGHSREAFNPILLKISSACSSRLGCRIKIIPWKNPLEKSS